MLATCAAEERVSEGDGWRNSLLCCAHIQREEAVADDSNALEEYYPPALEEQKRTARDFV